MLLAAGLSKRMGRPKQEAVLAGKTTLDRSIDSFGSSAVDEVVVVVGRRYTPRTGSGPSKVRFVVNPRPSRGLSSSIAIGLKESSSTSQAVIIGLGDKPLVKPSTVNTLIEVYRRQEPGIVIPTFKGRRGNPILFDSGFFAALMKLKGDRGAKGLIRDNEQDVVEVACDDEGVLVDVNTPEDLARAEAILAAENGN